MNLLPGNDQVNLTMPTLQFPQGSSFREQRLTEHLTDDLLVERLEEASSLQKSYILSLVGHNFISENVSTVWIVKNNFLEAMYLLKKAELSCRFGLVNEKLLFHVTREDAVDSIVSENFDWRRVKRRKFGLGISFSDDILYCHKFANFNIGHKRALIITRVIVCNYKSSNPDELVPPKEFDTIVGNRQKVFVKFSDNEFLPVFVVFYDVSNVDPRDILEEYPRSVHIQVLEGVNKYLQNQRYRKHRHAPGHRVLRIVNPSNQLRPFNHQTPGNLSAIPEAPHANYSINASAQSAISGTSHPVVVNRGDTTPAVIIEATGQGATTPAVVTEAPGQGYTTPAVITEAPGQIHTVPLVNYSVQDRPENNWVNDSEEDPGDCRCC